jgi:hypothetical protein
VTLTPLDLAVVFAAGVILGLALAAYVHRPTPEEEP